MFNFNYFFQETKMNVDFIANLSNISWKVVTLAQLMENYTVYSLNVLVLF